MIVQADLERLLIELEERRRTISRKELDEVILDCNPASNPSCRKPRHEDRGHDLRRAVDLVGGDRQVTHGDKAINFANTAGLWNAILEAKARKAGWPVA